MDRSRKPIPGETYGVFVGFEWVNYSERSFKLVRMKREVYAYKKYTEEELLKKFNMKKIIGYQPQKEFYKPSFNEIKDDTFPDYRKTLLWKPNIVTVNNGKAKLDFYTSDITSKFIIIILVEYT